MSFFRKSQQPATADFSAEWLTILRDNVLFYRLLTDTEQARLRMSIQTFVHSKYWEGCAGQVITDEVRITIAGQACLLVLGFDDYCFDELKTVIVYPGGFLSPSGIGDDEEEYKLGEALHGGPVALSWWDARWAGRRLSRTNVVLHEFAHKLAELGDAELGMPPLADASVGRRWHRVIGQELRQLKEDAEYGRPTLLDPYGASDRSEFFAVATETFFLEPGAMQRRHPELYDLLAACYRQDPASRRVDEAVAAQAAEADRDYARHAVEESTAAIRLRPAFLDLYRDRAGYYLDLGEIDNAIADYTMLIDSASSDGDRAEALLDRGHAWLSAENRDKAMADFTEAIQLDLEFARAWCDRGALRAELGRHEEALADLTRAVKLDPKDDAAWNERGLVHGDLGDHEKAIRDFGRAIRLYPHGAEAYCHRARSWLKLGNRDEALSDSSQAIRLDPKYAEAYRARAEALTLLGRTAEADRDRAEAERLSD